MTTAELENPAKASPGVNTLVTNSNASEHSATMSERTLSAMKAIMVRAKVATTTTICPVGEAINSAA